jgi:hypothetical protein
MRQHSTHRAKKWEPRATPFLLPNVRHGIISRNWLRTAEESRLSAVPATDPRDGAVLAARQVPREQWRHSHTWGRCYRHFCRQSRHRPADAESLQLFMGQLASEGQTAAQRAHAQGAVDYDAAFWSPEVRALRDGDTVAPTAPQDGEDGLAARKQERVIGRARMMEEQAQVLRQANGAREQANAAWRAVAATLNDERLRRHASPKTRHA